MYNKQQMNFNPKMFKLCDKYELGRTWKETESSPNSYLALEDKAVVVLKLENYNVHDMVFFKKGAIISINEGLLEYYENDLL